MVLRGPPLAEPVLYPGGVKDNPHLKWWGLLTLRVIYGEERKFTRTYKMDVQILYRLHTKV